jgi:nucleotide-binding universal stress UspA family protein
MTKILALIDASKYATSVTALSAWVAGRLGLPIEIVHVLGRRIASNLDLSGSLEANARTELLTQMAELDEQHGKLAQQKGRTILEAARLEVEARGGQASTKLRHGDLIEALSDLESDAEMVVIGKRGEAADFAKMHLGSNLERVVRASKKPVLVAARAYAPFNRFLIAYDGGRSANRAVEYVATSTLLKGMECEILSVGTDTPENRSRLEAPVRVLQDAGFMVHPTLEGGDPEDVIQKHVEARGTGLLVMGAYGHSRIRSLIIGSTTTELLRRCRIPVLMFR